MTVALALLVAALLALGLWAWTPDLSRAAVEARWLARADDMIEVAGARLHVRDRGPREAPAVILLHGFGASLHTWEPWTEALLPTFRVISLDLPAFGLTGPDPTGDYSMRRGNALLVGLMDRLGVSRAHLVGHSMGGGIAWRFAADHPERVERLVLIASDGFASGRGGGSGRPSLAAQAMRFVLPAFLVRMSLEPAYVDRTQVTGALVERYRDLLRAPGVRGAILERMAARENLDAPATLRRVTAPTLLLWGDGDRMVPARHAADYQAALPDSRLVVLEGLGHLPHEEAPARSLAPVRAFLAGEG